MKELKVLTKHRVYDEYSRGLNDGGRIQREKALGIEGYIVKCGQNYKYSIFRSSHSISFSKVFDVDLNLFVWSTVNLHDARLKFSGVSFKEATLNILARYTPIWLFRLVMRATIWYLSPINRILFLTQLPMDRQPS